MNKFKNLISYTANLNFILEKIEDSQKLLMSKFINIKRDIIKIEVEKKLKKYFMNIF